MHSLGGLRVAEVSVVCPVSSTQSWAVIMTMAWRISDEILGRPLAPHHAETEAASA